MNLMMKKIVNFYKKLGFFQGAILTLCLTSAISIATVNIPGFYTFTGGTPISASQVNSNFEKLAGLIDNSRSQNYIGAWDASINLPDIGASAPQAGDYYIVSTAGTYNSISFAAGDWAIFNGISWEKIHPTNGAATFEESFAYDSLGFSGRLVQTNGSPVTGPVTIRVELAYTNAPSTILCSQDISGVTLTNGAFHQNLNFDCSPKTFSQVLGEVPFGESATIKVTDLTHSKSYASQTITPAPLANIAQQLPQLGATDGEVLKWNNTVKRWEPGVVSGGGGGTVTSVSGVAPITVTSGTSTPSISIPQATSSTNGYLSSADWNTFNNKEGPLSAGTSTQYYRGDKTWQTLNTDSVPEGVNLYFTNARVLGVPLTGFASSSNVVVTSADTVLLALEKLQGQINAVNSTASSFLTKNSTDSITGVVNVGTTGLLQLAYVPVGMNDAANKQYVDNTVNGSATWATNSGDINRLTGNVGIGTTTPAAKLHIVGSGSADTKAIIDSGNMSYNAVTEYKQSSNTGSVGFLGGGDFVVQTIGSNYLKLGTQSATRMTIDPTGNVGIGTNSPSAKLDVNGPANIMGNLNANALTINGMTNANGDINISGGFALKINSTQICTTSGCTAISDQRYKENIFPLENSLEKILSLQAYEYDFKKEFKISDKHQIGVIAQEVEKVFPEVVITDKKSGFKSVAYDHLVAPLIESVKSIYKAVVNIKKQMSFHEQEIESLKAENKMLKDYLCQKDKNAPMCE